MNNSTVQSTIKVSVKPEYLCAGLAKHLETTVRDKLENSWTEECGFINSVRILPSAQPGLCNTRDGSVQFTVAYEAQALKPTLNQHVHAKVVSVTPLGINLQYGPLPIFVSNRLMADYKFAKHSYRSPTRKPIGVNDIVHVELLGLKWRDNQYDSVGALL